MRQSFTRVLLTGLLIVGCTPKASDSGGSGGNNSSSGGSNGSSSGGNNGSSSGGSNGSSSGGKTGSSSGGSNGSSSGGSNGSSSGGKTGSGGSNSSGSGGSNSSGSGGATVSCTADTSNLVNAGSWVCDADTSIKIQGAFYIYSDGMSCTMPSPNKPCTDKGCCVSGTTTVSDMTTNYANWGCGIGMELNSSGGDMPTKMAYAGPSKCFTITLTGSSGGNSVRIGFTQSTTTTDVAPFVDIAPFDNGFSQKICFADAMCPDWAATQGCTKATGADGTPYDLQVQVSAGSSATTVGAYNLCITSIVPDGVTGGTGSGGGTGSTGSGGSTGSTTTCQSPSGGPSTITDPFGVGMVACGSQQYVVQNNDWGAKMGQTITYGKGTTMKVTQQTGVGQNNAPASFPSIFIGQNSGHSSGDTPKAVSSIKAGDLPTSWTWADNGATGSYNAAYDVWFSTSSSGEPTEGNPSGGFLMVWYHKPSDNQPIGTMKGTANIAGVNWNIWEGNNSSNNKPCITYQAVTSINTLSFKLGDFIRDAVDKQKFLQDSWYLTNVFAGFEIWNGGQGLETKDFTATMK